MLMQCAGQPQLVSQVSIHLPIRSFVENACYCLWNGIYWCWWLWLYSQQQLWVPGNGDSGSGHRPAPSCSCWGNILKSLFYSDWAGRCIFLAPCMEVCWAQEGIIYCLQTEADAGEVCPQDPWPGDFTPCSPSLSILPAVRVPLPYPHAYIVFSCSRENLQNVLRMPEKIVSDVQTVASFSCFIKSEH